MEPFLTRPARSSAPSCEPRQSARGRGGGVPGRRSDRCSDRRSDSSPAGARRVPVTGHSSTRGEHGTRRDTRSKTGTRTEALTAGTRVGAPDVRGGSLHLGVHQPRRSAKGARERGPRGTLAPRVPSPDLCVDTRTSAPRLWPRAACRHRSRRAQKQYVHRASCVTACPARLNGATLTFSWCLLSIRLLISVN